MTAVYVIARNPGNEVLLVRRVGDGNWELPGGRIEVGESASATAVRVVADQAGVPITVTALAGVNTDPRHVLVCPDQTVQQEIAICFHATAPNGVGFVRCDTDEISQARWFEPLTTTALPMHPTMRQRLTHATGPRADTDFD